MDWECYRQLCDRGDVHSRYLLERTARLLREAEEVTLAHQLERVLGAAPLPRPAAHRAGPEADFFEVDLELADVQRIRLVVACARARGERTPEGRNLGGFVEAWQEFEGWLDGSHPRSPRGGRGE